jgi:hypothetical protein
MGVNSPLDDGYEMTQLLTLVQHWRSAYAEGEELLKGYGSVDQESHVTSALERRYSLESQIADEPGDHETAVSKLEIALKYAEEGDPSWNLVRSAFRDFKMALAGHSPTMEMAA